MLRENIKTLRKAKGLSQEELSVKLNVVRQTISKWEQGLSVPDSDMLILLAENLDSSVHVLLGDTIEDMEADDIKSIAEKLEILNLQLARQKENRRKMLRLILILVCVLILVAFIFLLKMRSPYLGWDYTDPEHAVLGVLWHILEWIFVRTAPFAIVGCIVGIILLSTKK